jgi:hypothetical protein
LLSSISLGLLVLKFWALVDVTRHTAQAFDFVGRGTKNIWLAGTVISVLSHLFMGGAFGLWGIIGTVACGVYLVDIRHQLASLRR